MNIYHNHWTPLEPLLFKKRLFHIKKTQYTSNERTAAVSSNQSASSTGGVGSTTKNNVFAGEPGQTPIPPGATKSVGKKNIGGFKTPDFQVGIFPKTPGGFVGSDEYQTGYSFLYNVLVNPSPFEIKTFKLDLVETPNGEHIYQMPNGININNLQDRLPANFQNIGMDKKTTKLFIDKISSIKNNKYYDDGFNTAVSYVSYMPTKSQATVINENGFAVSVFGEDLQNSTFSLNYVEDKDGKRSLKTQEVNPTSLTVVDSANFQDDGSFEKYLPSEAFKTPEQIAKEISDKKQTSSLLTPDWVQTYIYGTSAALASAANVGSLWLGYRQFKESKRQYEEQKERLLREENRQIRSYNSQLGDHLSGRGFVNSSSTSLRNISKDYNAQKFNKVDK